MVSCCCLSCQLLTNVHTILSGFFLFYLFLRLFGVFVHLQGANASALEKEIGSEQFPVNEHYFGLVNVSEPHSLKIQCFEYIST